MGFVFSADGADILSSLKHRRLWRYPSSVELRSGGVGAFLHASLRVIWTRLCSRLERIVGGISNWLLSGFVLEAFCLRIFSGGFIRRAFQSNYGVGNICFRVSSSLSGRSEPSY
jgi:hypothetical protein